MACTVRRRTAVISETVMPETNRRNYLEFLMAECPQARCAVAATALGDRPGFQQRFHAWRAKQRPPERGMDRRHQVTGSSDLPPTT